MSERQRIFCGTCGVEYECKQNAIIVGFKHAPNARKVGDWWVCPKCEHSLVTGLCGLYINPATIHEPEFIIQE